MSGAVSLLFLPLNIEQLGHKTKVESSHYSYDVFGNLVVIGPVTLSRPRVCQEYISGQAICWFSRLLSSLPISTIPHFAHGH